MFVFMLDCWMEILCSDCISEDGPIRIKYFHPASNPARKQASCAVGFILTDFESRTSKKMSDLTTEEKIYLIECFFSKGKVYSSAYREFRNKYGVHRIANENTLKSVIDNFILHGTVQDPRREILGPSYVGATEQILDNVENYFDENPNVSKKVAQVLEIKKTSLHRILQKILKLHPYMVTTHQLLTERAKEKRVEFSKTIAQLLGSKEIKENQIIFSDEAHFWLNGYVNKQNCHFWGQESPQVSLSKPLHLQEVTVWAALSVKGVYIEFLESPITAENYKELLQTKFFPFAKENDLVEKFYFMQDGMTPHRTREVFEAIYEVYEDRVIGLSCPKFFQGGIEWPSYSPDLNPCDFFLWGYIKDNCYSKSPKTKEELIEAIKKVVTDITSECLYNVLYSFHKRVDFCSNSNGAHFGNIYH